MPHHQKNVKNSQNSLFKKAVNYWGNASKAEKIIILLLLVLTVGGAVFLALKMDGKSTIGNESTSSKPHKNNYPSNRLSIKEQKAAARRIKEITKVDPRVIEGAHKYLGDHAVPYIKQISSYKDFVVSSLGEAVTTKVHKDTLEKEDLKILIRNKDAMKEGPSFYAGAINTIVISEEPIRDKQDVIASFDNEIFSASVHRRNNELGCPLTGSTLDDEPFCENGKFDNSEDKASELKKAMNKGFNRIDRLYDISHKIQNNQKISPRDRQFYDECVSIIKDYEFGYEKAPLLKPTNGVVSNKSLHDKIVIFSTSINQERSLVFGPQSPYREMHGSKKYLAEKLSSEMASYIASYPDPIRAIFFDEYCQYFSQYFNVDYCDSNSLSI